MKDSRRESLLRTAAEDLAILLGGTEAAQPLRSLEPKGRSFATVAVDKLEEYAEGWPAGGATVGGPTNVVETFIIPGTVCPDCLGEKCDTCEQTGHRIERLPVPQHSDRTGESAIVERITVPTIRHFDALLTQIAALLHQASSIATEAVVPVNAAPEKAKDNPDDWCASCARLKDHKGRAFAVPSALCNGSVRRTPEGTKDATAGAALCGFCYGWTLGEQAWPPLKIIEHRRDGVRITTKIVENVKAAS